jgi:hypothetical protein
MLQSPTGSSKYKTMETQVQSPIPPEWLRRFRASLEEIASAGIGSSGRKPTTGDRIAAELLVMLSPPPSLDVVGVWIWQYLKDPSPNRSRQERGTTVKKSLRNSIRALENAMTAYQHAADACVPLVGVELLGAGPPAELQRESNRLKPYLEKSNVAYSTKRLGRDRNLLPLILIQEFVTLMYPHRDRLGGKELALLLRAGKEASGDDSLVDSEPIEKNLKNLRTNPKNEAACNLTKQYARDWFRKVYPTHVL